MTKKDEIIRKNPYKPVLKKIIYYQRESPDTFTIRLDWKLKHDPGQFVFCSLPGIGEAPISICSYNREYVELNIREVGNVTNALAKLKKGDKLLVRGPYGTTYPMDYFKDNNIIIVGGGCGVAPLKAVIEYINKHRHDFLDVSLFFGYRAPTEILFKDHMNTWKKKYNIYVSFDKLEKKTKSCLIGTQGFVTQLIEQNVHDNHQKVVLICGPPIMIEKTAEILLNKGFNPDQIYLSAERLMRCGIGMCGRCMIHGRYTCLDGSVFRYDKLKGLKDD